MFLSMSETGKMSFVLFFRENEVVIVIPNESPSKLQKYPEILL